MMATNPSDWYRDTRRYLHEVQAEYNKITWPPQKEAVVGMIGVVVLVGIVTTVLSIVDFGLSQLMQLVLQ
jgi:preprotein translocase SecE subunit